MTCIPAYFVFTSQIYIHSCVIASPIGWQHEAMLLEAVHDVKLIIRLVQVRFQPESHNWQVSFGQHLEVSSLFQLLS